MKIPETSANVGAYYGNEENGHWQPNGMIIDNGVGGGVVGSGDAGLHRGPMYPVHIPRGQMPGYVVHAGPYYPPAYQPVPPQPQDDFADYMWMEHEEEFDKQVMQQLEEEALMEQCIEAMLEDEQRERRNRPNGHKQYPTTSNGAPSVSLEEAVSRSTLNPLAAEFVPTRIVPSTQTENSQHNSQTEDSEQRIEERQTNVEEVNAKVEIAEETKTEESVEPQKDPPEVSAADVQPIDKSQEKKAKDSKRDVRPRVETKRSNKTEVKKSKPMAAKSETIVQTKKDIKQVKSEIKVDEGHREERAGEEEIKYEKEIETSPAVDVVKLLPTPCEEAQAPSGFKPINYAAAAKANKPKKPSPPPMQEKIPPPPTKQKSVEKKEKKIEKSAPKDKPVVRKNSVK